MSKLSIQKGQMSKFTLVEQRLPVAPPGFFFAGAGG
jgi:hypothetical protein